MDGFLFTGRVMVPASREEFKSYCLRKLGWPVISIEVDDDQVEDRIDESLKYFADYHFDGTEILYYKHAILANNFPDRIHSVSVIAGGSGYSNADTITFTGGNPATNAANATLTTNGNGAITAVTLADNGYGYKTPPTITINTSGGTGANVIANLGGFIELPDNIIGVVKIFDLSSSFVSDNMFSIQYQIALNDLYTLTSQSMVPYYITMTHLALIQQILIGQQPIRYTRHRNRLHIDMNWDRLNVGDYVVVEAFQVIDPNEFTDVWGDRWLAKYTTALIKKQWGNHLKKYSGGMQLPSGMSFNGQQIYDEANEEIEKLEEEMISTYSIPLGFIVG